MNRKVDSGALFTGLMFIAFGSLFLLDRMDIIRFGEVIQRGWPAFFIIIGVAKLLRGHIWGGLWTIAVGAWFFAVTLHLFGLRWANAWPLLLIVLGAGMIVRTLFEAMRRREPAAPEQSHDAR